MTSAENWVTTHKKIETYFSDFSKICYSVSKAKKAEKIHERDFFFAIFSRQIELFHFHDFYNFFSSNGTATFSRFFAT